MTICVLYTPTLRRVGRDCRMVDSDVGMIRGGFLSPEDRHHLIALSPSGNTAD